MDQQKEFDDAVQKINSLTVRPTDEEMLELYGLYKQSTVGNVNISKPYFWNTVERAKYDVWESKKCMHPIDAKKKYAKYANAIIEKYSKKDHLMTIAKAYD